MQRFSYAKLAQSYDVVRQEGVDRLVTIKQIAERAGVSTATVSNVIHGKTKRVSPANVERIQKLIEEMGYAQNDSGRKRCGEANNLIAVVINSHKEYEEAILSDPFYGKTIGCIEQRLREMGYYMLLYSAEDVDDIFQMAMTWDVTGVITITLSWPYCDKLRNMIRKPVVSIDAHGIVPGPAQVTNVGLNEQMGGRLMVEHLLRQGYEDIYVCATRDFGNDHLRWVGARQAWEQYHPANRRLQLLIAGVSQKEREAFYQSIVDWKASQRRIAIFFLSDYMAIEALSYLTSRGLRVPEQIGIAGYDDIIYAGKLRLTTIHQDIRQKAERAVDELCAMMNNPDYTPQNVVLPVSLVQRRTT